MHKTTMWADVIVGLENALGEYTLPGSVGCISWNIYLGFQHEWNAVTTDVLKNLKAQLQAHLCMHQVYPLQILFS